MADILLPNPDERPGAPPSSPGLRSERAVEIVNILEGYRKEAEQARATGPNARDAKWDENLALFWNRMDFTGKADWQAKEVMPEVPSFLLRFAAALKEGWTAATAAGAYTVLDPADPDNDMTPAVKDMLDYWLTTVGRNQQGYPLGIESVIEEQVLLGALMATSAVVGWREDTAWGRPAIETVDPRTVWLDPTYRNLYRVRKVDMDLHEVLAKAGLRDRQGRHIYNLPEIEALGSDRYQRELDAERLAGHGQALGAGRREVTLHEYYGTVVTPMGQVLAKDALSVVADNRYLIRGPEANPFWHGRDWLVFAPLITVPLSVYGRTYAEDFASIAKTFNQLTNLILDAVFTSSMKVFAIIPEMLRNPADAAGGLHPGKTYQLEMGLGGGKDFMHALDLGTLGPDTVRVWEALKNELREAAGINEIGLGQFAPNSRTSATEIGATESNSSALVRSVAQTLETRLMEPMLDLTWKTGVQHMKKGDMGLVRAVGPEMYGALFAHRKELVSRPITFQVRGISTLIAKGQKLKALLNILQVVGGNPILLQQFLQVADLEKLVNLLFDLSNLDIRRITKGQREQALAQLMPALGQAAGPALPGAQSGAGLQGAANLANSMGVGK